MKSLKLVLVSSVLALGTISAVVYSSCSKDKCKDVTCQHGGTCSGGTCTCPTGTGDAASECATIYEAAFVNTYKGDGTDNGTPPNSYPGFRFAFSIPGSSTDYVTMNVSITDNTGASVGVPILTITLSNFTTSSASFTITSATSAGLTFTGTGTLTATTATMSLKQSETGVPDLTISFPVLTKV